MDSILDEVIGFDWDAGNLEKVTRRLPKEVAEGCFLGAPLVMFDEAHSQDEPRWILLNAVGERFVTLIFTVRKKKARILSARYMHAREVKKYDQKIKKQILG